MNRNLCKDTNCSSKKDSRYKNTTIAEMKKFYAIQMAMENTYGNEYTNLESHVKGLKAKFTNWPRGLGLDRIRAIRAAIVLNKNELQAISNFLHKNFVDQIDINSVNFIFSSLT